MYPCMMGNVWLDVKLTAPPAAINCILCEIKCCWRWSLFAMVVVCNGRCLQWSLFAMVVVGNGRCWQWSLMFLLAMVLPPMNRSASCEHCLSYLYGIVMDCWCYSLTISLSPYYALLETREHVCYKCEGRKSPETFFDKIPSYSVKNKDLMRTL